MSLTSEVKSIIETRFPDATVILSSWFKANVASFNIAEMTLAKPFIIISNEVKKSKEIQENFNILADSNLIIWFLVDVSVYATDDTMNTAIEALEVMADQIFSIINQENNIRLKGSELLRYNIDPKFKIFNAALAGVEANGRVKENQVRDICKVPPTP